MRNEPTIWRAKRPRAPEGTWSCTPSSRPVNTAAGMRQNAAAEDWHYPIQKAHLPIPERLGAGARRASDTLHPLSWVHLTLLKLLFGDDLGQEAVPLGSLEHRTKEVACAGMPRERCCRGILKLLTDPGHEVC